MSVQDVFPHTVVHVFGIPIRDTVLQSLFMVIVLGVLVYIVRSRYKAFEIDTWQALVEWLVEYVEDLVRSTSGQAMPQTIPFLTTLIVFVGLGSLLSLLPGLQAPTRDINTTAALSCVALGSWIYFGVKAKGVGGYLHSYLEPVALLLPLNILSTVSRLFAMALRLFGNVISGEIISAVIFMLVPVAAPLPFNLLGMVTSVLQAIVFTVLTLVFIADAIGEDDTAGEVVTEV